MSKQEEKMKIVFENGDARCIRPIEVPSEIMKSFAWKTALKLPLKRTSMYKPVVKALKRWLDKAGLHHPEVPEMCQDAAAIIAKEQAARTGGFVALTLNDGEVVVVSQREGNRVWRISKMVYDEVKGQNQKINWDGEIVETNFYLGSIEEGMQHFAREIDRAVAVEKYEKAAFLRDELNLMYGKLSERKFLKDITDKHTQ